MSHQIPKLKCFLSPLAVVFAKSIEARCSVENEDVVGAAPTGDAPTTSELSTMLLPTKVRLIIEVFRYKMAMAAILSRSQCVKDISGREGERGWERAGVRGRERGRGQGETGEIEGGSREKERGRGRGRERKTNRQRQRHRNTKTKGQKQRHDITYGCIRNFGETISFLKGGSTFTYNDIHIHIWCMYI